MCCSVRVHRALARRVPRRSQLLSIRLVILIISGSSSGCFASFTVFIIVITSRPCSSSSVRVLRVCTHTGCCCRGRRHRVRPAVPPRARNLILSPSAAIAAIAAVVPSTPTTPAPAALSSPTHDAGAGADAAGAGAVASPTAVGSPTGAVASPAANAAVAAAAAAAGAEAQAAGSPLTAAEAPAAADAAPATADAAAAGGDISSSPAAAATAPSSTPPTAAPAGAAAAISLARPRPSPSAHSAELRSLVGEHTHTPPAPASIFSTSSHSSLPPLRPLSLSSSRPLLASSRPLLPAVLPPVRLLPMLERQQRQQCHPQQRNEPCAQSCRCCRRTRTRSTPPHSPLQCSSPSSPSALSARPPLIHSWPLAYLPVAEPPTLTALATTRPPIRRARAAVRMDRDTRPAPHTWNRTDAASTARRTPRLPRPARHPPYRRDRPGRPCVAPRTRPLSLLPLLLLLSCAFDYSCSRCSHSCWGISGSISVPGSRPHPAARRRLRRVLACRYRRGRRSSSGGRSSRRSSSTCTRGSRCDRRSGGTDCDRCDCSSQRSRASPHALSSPTHPSPSPSHPPPPPPTPTPRGLPSPGVAVHRLRGQRVLRSARRCHFTQLLSLLALAAAPFADPASTAAAQQHRFHRHRHRRDATPAAGRVAVTGTDGGGSSHITTP